MSSASQMLKGLLEGCILIVVSLEETYGYEICERLSTGGFKEISKGSVYPILLRLEKKGYVAAVMKDSPLGPKRKYYHITSEGKDVLNNFYIEWNILRDTVDNFVKEVSNNEKK